MGSVDGLCLVFNFNNMLADFKIFAILVLVWIPLVRGDDLKCYDSGNKWKLLGSQKEVSCPNGFCIGSWTAEPGKDEKTGVLTCIPHPDYGEYANYGQNKDKYWKMEDNKLVNKDEDWEPKQEWKITKVPGKNKEGNVEEENYNKNKLGQLWKKGIADDNGYFTLMNKESSEFLAADSDGGFKVKGISPQLEYENKRSSISRNQETFL